MYSTDKISVSILTFSRNQGSRKKQIPITWLWHLILNVTPSNSLLYDLRYLWLYTWLQTWSWCPILTNSRSVISKKLKLFTWPWQLTFKFKVKYRLLYDFLHFWLYIWYRLDLRVERSLLFDATNLAVIRKFFSWPQRMTLKIKVRVTYCDPLFIMGCIRDRHQCWCRF